MRRFGFRICCCLQLALLFAISTLNVAALDPGKTLTQYAHRIWGEEEGLFQPTIYSILQTRNGFLWLGTQDSLIRFDGVHFREFDVNGKPILHGNLIRSLFEDSDGNLWAASVGGGVAKITPQGTLTRYTTQNGLPANNTFCVASDSQHRIWICTANGLARLDRSGHFRVFTTSDGLPTNRIRSTCESSAGTRWVAGLDFGLVRFDGSRFRPYSDPRIPIDANISTLECAADGTVWVGTNMGVTQITGTTSRTFTTRDGLPDNAVSALEQDRGGNIWIGTNDGISRFRNGQISAYRTRDGLSHSLVLSLYVDREGTLWAGTIDGLDQFTDGKVTPYTTNEGMLSNNAGPVLEDATGRLWIGTLDSGLDSFDGHTFRAITQRDGLLSNTILSLSTSKDGDLWVGTNKGLNRLHNNKIAATYTVNDGLSGPEVRALFIDLEGTLWIGTNKGLDRLKGDRLIASGAGPFSNLGGITALAGSPTMKLFVGAAESKFYYIHGQELEKYPLGIGHNVDCYYFDRTHHAVWIGTSGSGLLRWQNGTLTHIRVSDGLYDNRIYSILRDDKANFWLASSKGIFRISEQELEDFSAGKSHSVNSIPFSTGQLRFECRSNVQPAACRTQDGRLWFSTTNGLVMIDPNRLTRNRIPPPVQITAVIVNGQHIDPSHGIDLKPSEKNVEIRYAGLSFVSPEKMSFRYILDGYDKTWTGAGARREAFFTNLPPGRFQFKVMAQNADGMWSTGPGTVSFHIQPRLYQRRWFFPALAALLALLITAGYRIRIRRLKQRFDLVLGERTRIARELHDTLLQGLSGITMQLQALWTRLPASKEKQFLGDIIKDAGRCSSDARQSLWGLRAARPQSLEFSEKLASLAHQTVAGSHTALSLQLDPLSLNPFPELEYQLLRIAREALTNSIRHSRAKTVELRLHILGQQLQMTIQDDGIGFAEGIERAQFGHFGLIGMRERAKEIGAAIDIWSASHQGTKVSVSMPLSRSHAQEGNVENPLERQLR